MPRNLSLDIAEKQTNKTKHPTFQNADSGLFGESAYPQKLLNIESTLVYQSCITVRKAASSVFFKLNQTTTKLVLYFNIFIVYGTSFKAIHWVVHV